MIYYGIKLFKLLHLRIYDQSSQLKLKRGSFLFVHQKVLYFFSKIMLTLYPCNETSDIETTIEIEVSIRRAIFFAGPKIFEMKDSELKKY